jgi:hypothetical protein
MMPHPCRSCGAPIFYATTPDGRKMPLDAQPQKRFVTRPSRDVRDEIDCKLVETYTTHFATCPNAAQHRKPRGG